MSPKVVLDVAESYGSSDNVTTVESSEDAVMIENINYCSTYSTSIIMMSLISTCVSI